MPTAADNRRKARNLLAKDPNYGAKTDAERETERRISEFYRTAYPMPWDKDEQEVED